jgi:hypothetical protein
MRVIEAANVVQAAAIQLPKNVLIRKMRRLVFAGGLAGAFVGAAAGLGGAAVTAVEAGDVPGVALMLGFGSDMTRHFAPEIEEKADESQSLRESL